MTRRPDTLIRYEVGARAVEAAGPRGRHLLRGDSVAKRTCSIEGCDGVHWGRGYCQRHYNRWLKHGDPGEAAPFWRAAAPDVRFWLRVDKRADGCWIWTGSRQSQGYGTLHVDGRSTLAHRYGYQLVVGPIPIGLELDHLCRVPLCVNPEHLEPVTHAENMGRGLRGALKTHCAQGHPWAPENTVANGHTKSGRAKRRCRICMNDARRKQSA